MLQTVTFQPGLGGFFLLYSPPIIYTDFIILNKLCYILLHFIKTVPPAKRIKKGWWERSKSKPSALCGGGEKGRKPHSPCVSELVRREPTVMGIIPMDTGSHMMVHLVERNHGTAPHPLSWKPSVSLLILIPQILLYNIRLFWYSSQAFFLFFFILSSEPFLTYYNIRLFHHFSQAFFIKKFYFVICMASIF